MTIINKKKKKLYFEGHDTTSAAISWAIHALGKYPDAQERVYKELMQVIGDRQIKWLVGQMVSNGKKALTLV